MAGSGETPEIQWLAPWHDVADDGVGYAAVLEQQLKREVAPGHPLHGIPVEAAGKAEASDDAVFRLLDGSGRVAMVHLTWSRPPETPPWPITGLYASAEEWVVDAARPRGFPPRSGAGRWRAGHQRGGLIRPLR